MILDRGTCKIYRKTRTTPAGGKPTWTWAAIHESYYGELSFETTPARPTERREETETATRIRILQNRGIRNQDVAELTPFDGTRVIPVYFRITRAWHGDDGDSGAPISDLTLTATEKPELETVPAASDPAPASGTETNGTTGGDEPAPQDEPEVTDG